MATTSNPAPPEVDDPATLGGPEPGFWTRWFGPLTPWRIAALVAAFAFLGGSIGWAIRDRQAASRPTKVDVGFAQDMIAHHDQAVEMALTVLGDPTLPAGVRNAAQEIIIFQRYEVGLLNDALARWGRSTEGNGTSMGWMGRPVATDKMPGLATEAEMTRLSDAKGSDAGALFLAMMSRHHLAGVDMAKAAAKHASDRITVTLAKSMARNQAIEINEYRQLRRRLELEVPPGFTDPPTLSGSEHDSHGG